MMLLPLLACLAAAPGLSLQGAGQHRDLEGGGVVAPPGQVRAGSAGQRRDPEGGGVVAPPGQASPPSREPPEDLGLGESLMQVSFETRQHIQVPAGLSLPVVLVGALVGFLAGSHISPYTPKAVVGYVVCGVYIAFSVAIDLSIATQKKRGDGKHHHSYDFSPACSVLMTEAVKFGISTLLFCAERWKVPRSTFWQGITFNDVRWLCVPSVVYTVSNILVFQAIGKNDMSTFGVFRDTMILWTALLWKSVFGTSLGLTRILAICIIFTGLVINKASATGSGHGWSWAFLWVLLMTCCNALGSVVNEYALKLSRGLDINIQNMVLYFGTFCCCLLYIMMSDMGRLTGGAGTFFNGFDNKTWFTIGLQSVTGLLVSRILKHADAVMKTVATCLRGPILVFVAPLVTESHVGLFIAISACVVAAGCMVYLTQGTLKTSREVDEEAKRLGAKS